MRRYGEVQLYICIYLILLCRYIVRFNIYIVHLTTYILHSHDMNNYVLVSVSTNT